MAMNTSSVMGGSFSKGSFNGTTSYEVLVSTNGCLDRDSVTIFVETSDTCEITTADIYNMISPNGDGNNDSWFINGITAFKDNTVSIFNRWGNKVWEGKDYDNDKVLWRGQNQSGEKLPAGTYYYVIEFGDKKISGFVELVR